MESKECGVCVFVGKRGQERGGEGEEEAEGEGLGAVMWREEGKVSSSRTERVGVNMYWKESTVFVWCDETCSAGQHSVKL